MRCQHENADHLKPGDFYNDAADACFGPYEASCEQLRCLDCGDWLSLGPARDTPEALAELWAAELASEGVVPFAGCLRASVDAWAHGPDHVCSLMSAPRSPYYGDRNEGCLRCDAIRLAFEMVEHS